MRSLPWWNVLALLLLIGACRKGDKVPAYIEIPSVSLTTTALQGAPTSRITDVWVSVNDELLGVWELPARVPALYEGAVELQIVPAIKRNGMYDDRLRYPYYAPFIAPVDLVRNSSIAVAPVVRYVDQTQFWIESFDAPGTLLNVTPASDTTLLRFTPTEYPDLVQDNSPCGGFVLDPEHPYIRLYTDEDFDVYGGPVFLEVDYRSDIQFTVGVIYTLNGTPSADPYVYVASTGSILGATRWGKIHIDLSPVFNTGISQRDVFIEARLPGGRSSGTVLLDNIKLLRVLP